MSTPKACVIGHPIAHSRSPLLHNYWLRELGIAGSYEKIDVPPEALGEFFANFKTNGFIGANITVPHKTEAAKYVAVQDEDARAIGAINTVWYKDDMLVGGNTDAYGLIANLDERAPGWEAGGVAVCLGAGGAARAAVYGLRTRGMKVTLVNRTIENAEALARYFGGGVEAAHISQLGSLLESADLLVNTTSLGMTGKPPLELSLDPLKSSAVVYDVVYVPLETALLRGAAARGHRVVDGLGMLLHQAVLGFSRWFGKTPLISNELRAMLESDIRAASADGAR